MKHTFLLDENILYLAVKGVDERDNPDFTAAELLLLIGRNCHSITMDSELLGRYRRHVQKLQGVRSLVLEPVIFITQFINNSAKAKIEYSELPEVPAEVKVPDEDVHVVRAALSSHPLIVTSDEELREAINGQPALHLKALSPRDALALAREE